MIIEEEVYLQHFGKKGMKWGVRNTRTDGSEKKPKKKLTPQQKEHLTNLAIASGIIVGTVGIGILMHNHANKKVSSIPKINLDKDLDVKRLLAMSKNTKMPSPIKLKETINTSRPKVSSEHKKFLTQFNARQSLINKGANADLSRLYKLAETPIKDRGFLPEWG